MKTALVITTINNTNKNILRFSRECKLNKWDFIVIGDKKTPKSYNLKYGNFFSLKEQKNLVFNYSKICNENSYTRKNIGYLIALKKNNQILIETDDDNFPTKHFFNKRKKQHLARKILNKDWVNIYDLFTKKNLNIWPRGLPLEKIKNNKIKLSSKSKKNYFLLQQGLADNNPDVDAIYRLMNSSIKINFIKNKKIHIGKSIVPSNSQNTTWFKDICMLMYLPTTCSMRATDIYRGYVALNILNNSNLNILFHGSNLIQIRNTHNLLNDYEQELPIYLNSVKILKELKKLNFSKDKQILQIGLIKSYRLLISMKLIKKSELKFLNAWIRDINNIMSPHSKQILDKYKNQKNNL